MKTVGDILKGKPDRVLTIRPEASVLEALALMADANVGALVVTEGEHIAGILSERDCVRKLDIRGRNPRETPVRDIMTRSVVTVGPGQALEECMTLMTEKRFRHLPVMEGGRITGVVSIGDVVKATIAEQRFLIEQMRDYITGKGR